MKEVPKVRDNDIYEGFPREDWDYQITILISIYIESCTKNKILKKCP